MSKLFSPIKLGQLQLDNRIVVAPMCMYSAIEGQMTDWHLIHLGNMAMSGASMVIIEATAVEPIGRITDGCVGLWSDETEQAMTSVLNRIRPYTPTPFFIQLGHAGRKASSYKPWETGSLMPMDKGGWETVGPSAIPQLPSERPPVALDKAGLARIKKAFVDSAVRAKRIGFVGVELHAAHGYLLHQFLSPISNQRTDEYGGSLQNRMRYPLEVFEAVRKAVPDMALGIRISAVDWVDNGQTIEDSVAFGVALKALGCDFIHVSSGGISPQQSIPIGPCYQVPLAARIKAATGLPTIAVGLITEPEEAEALLEKGEADMVALARGMLFDPRWGWHAAAKLGGQVNVPPQYWRSQPRGFSTLFGDVKIGQR